MLSACFPEIFLKDIRRIVLCKKANCKVLREQLIATTGNSGVIATATYCHKSLDI